MPIIREGNRLDWVIGLALAIVVIIFAIFH